MREPAAASLDGKVLSALSGAYTFFSIVACELMCTGESFSFYLEKATFWNGSCNVTLLS